MNTLTFLCFVLPLSFIDIIKSLLNPYNPLLNNLKDHFYIVGNKSTYNRILTVKEVLGKKIVEFWLNKLSKSAWCVFVVAIGLSFSIIPKSWHRPNTERCPSGRWCTLGKGVCGLSRTGGSNPPLSASYELSSL